jgi:hypothetical protein
MAKAGRDKEKLIKKGIINAEIKLNSSRKVKAVKD